MISDIKNILGLTGSQYDLIIIIVCAWVLIYFIHLLFGVLMSSVNRL